MEFTEKHWFVANVWTGLYYGSYSKRRNAIAEHIDQLYGVNQSMITDRETGLRRLHPEVLALWDKRRKAGDFVCKGEVHYVDAISKRQIEQAAARDAAMV